MTRTTLGRTLRCAAASVAVLAGLGLAGCGSPAPTQPPAQAPTFPPEPTPPTNFCDLLTPADFTSIAQLQATAPSPSTASDKVSCVYGKDLGLDVFILTSEDAAKQQVQTIVKSGPVKKVKEEVMAAVDESIYGTTPKSTVMTIRRDRLVFTIKLPGRPEIAEPKLIQLTGLVLQRAASLGAAAGQAAA
jgi:hypothetical protein